MDPNLANSIAPQVIFFLMFFIAFSLIELIIIFLLNRLEMNHWKFMIDFIIRAGVHHGKAIRRTALLLIVILTAVLLEYTTVLTVARNASAEIQIFAGTLLFAMIAIYWTTTRKLAKLAIEKKIHKYIYVVISLVQIGRAHV